MYIVMHCGGLPFNGDTLKTQSLGGSETAAYYMAKSLAALGHKVKLFTNHKDTGTFDGVNYEWSGDIHEGAPLGERFHFYAENTPHDVCIIQRHPMAFARKLASKLNFWWLHDLALYRNVEVIQQQMWNVDRVLVVSEYHRDQVSKVYGIPKEMFTVVRNAIDHSLFEDLAEKPATADLNIVYSSRPERGLVHLVRVGGIMDKLAEAGMSATLHVCGYDNTTPQMRDMYEALWERCRSLPNVELHGALTKKELAMLMAGCDALVYPTEFEEVSCITAMEAMAAGCGIISSDFGALPETCEGSAAILLPLKNGEVDEALFVATIRDRLQGLRAASSANKEVSHRYSWDTSASEVCSAATVLFASATPLQLGMHYMRHSDIAALDRLTIPADLSNTMTGKLKHEQSVAYKFYREDTYAEHYAAFYQYEKDRGINYGPEDVTGTSRFMTVANYVSALPEGSRVLDYGCAHGHYTVALAAMFPKLIFVGADLAASNIEKAMAWAAQVKLTNVSFVHVGGVDSVSGDFDLIIAAEVIEHVGNPQYYVDTLSSLLRTAGGRMVITTPFGPWEAQGYREHGFWRAHLHHFERADLEDMLGHHPNFKMLVTPSGMSTFYSPLGSYIATFTKPTEVSREINYLRKNLTTMPDQTVSCCMIVKDGAADLARCLNSVVPHVQEFVIGVDETTRDSTETIIKQFAEAHPLVAFNFFRIESPRSIGFDAARNLTLDKAQGDWILWIDADEVLVGGEALPRLLRHNMYNGIALKQHHMSANPVGVIKVDLPCRLFRNRLGVRFFGLVHEHPELGLNEGMGPVVLSGETYLIHHGYTNERVRRGRFDRNLPLLKRDREVNPSRLLGKFLWLRDLAQACQYDIEAGNLNDAVFAHRIEEGLRMWEELVASGNLRVITDAMPYYSQLAQFKGGGFGFSVKMDANPLNPADASAQEEVGGYFASREHVSKLLAVMTETKLANVDSRYL